MTFETVLPATLAIAVPLWMQHLLDLQGDVRADTITAWARETVDQVIYEGDVLMYRGGEKGRPAELFNVLARGLAAGAFAPGGITFAGLHWCAEPHDPLPCPSRDRTPRRDVATVAVAEEVL